jgi:uncharacterized protein YndB with AHSA1/START domain
MTHDGEEALSISRVINATPRKIYQALLDPQAVAAWRPPAGMSMRIDAFEPRAGGVFRITLEYLDADHAVRGKTSEHADVVCGRFVALVPDERVVEAVEFESDDPEFAGTMLLTTTLIAVSGGTEVTIRVDSAPRGIRAEDHAAGMRSTLNNLAAFTE